jgi:hypothetical protein
MGNVTVYIAKAVSYAGKMFVKLPTGVSITKTFFLVYKFLDKKAGVFSS